MAALCSISERRATPKKDVCSLADHLWWQHVHSSAASNSNPLRCSANGSWLTKRLVALLAVGI